MKNLLTIFLLCNFTITLLTAQSKLDLATENIENNYLQEKVYLLFDKEEYVAGDPIHFKSFVFDGYERSTISNTLYVELYDQNKNLIDKKTILLENGQADGSLTTKASLKENVYFVRAYTSWMANFEDKWHFLKAVPIYNAESQEKLDLDIDNTWTAEAFAEGGTFIADIPTKIAVRFYTSPQNTSKWSAYVIDQSDPNIKLTNVQILDQNIGIFNLIPKSGKSYQVVVQDESGNSQTINLPNVAESGINLHIKNEKDGIVYQLTSSKLKDGLKNHHIIVMQGNKQVYKAILPTNSSQIKSIIPKNAVENSGILQIYVFDYNENLVAQRLVMLDLINNENSETFLVETQFNKVPRALNNFSIKVAPSFTDVSVLISNVNDDFVQDNLLSSIYLTEDFKSSIRFPAQYFSKSSNKDALDALLITEKWNRFDWNKAIVGTKPKIKYDIENNRYLSYTAKLAQNSRALPNTPVNLLVGFGDQLKPLQVTTDKNGEIILSNINYEESFTIHYYLNSSKTNSNNLTLTVKPLIPEKTYQPDFPKNDFVLKTQMFEEQRPIAVKQAIANRKNDSAIKDKEVQIEEIKLVKTKQDLKRKLNDQLSTGIFSSMNATIFDFVNENQEAITYSNILQWLQGRVAGLTFQNDNMGNITPYIRGSAARIYLDEMQMDASAISSVSAGDIALLKIIKGSSLLGNSILIYTRRGNMQVVSEKSPSKNNKIIVKAYDKILPFTMKNLETEVYPYIQRDVRQVLYWNPSVSLKNGISDKISFYNNDILEKRNITLIGIDSANRIIYQKITFD